MSRRVLINRPEPLWIVVKIESGIPVTVEAYRDRRSAEMREQAWRERMNPDNDESGVFEVQVRQPYEVIR